MNAMECSNPPPLSDDALSAVLDGAADRAALDHLAACPSCAARLAFARAAEGRLHARLRRFDCPPPDRLGEYHLSMLPADAERAIRSHLQTCARCQEELEQLRVFMLADDPDPIPASPPTFAPRPAPRPSRLRELVARLLPSPPTPALRGAPSRTRTYETDNGITVLLDAQPTAGGFVVTGQLLADDAAWEGSLVEARQNGALAATAALDDLAMFRIGPLAAAPAELRIASPAAESIVLPLLELEGL